MHRELKSASGTHLWKINFPQVMDEALGWGKATPRRMPGRARTLRRLARKGRAKGNGTEGIFYGGAEAGFVSGDAAGSRGSAGAKAALPRLGA